MELVKLTLRWPKSLAKAVEGIANKKDTFVQTIITEAVLDKYNVEHWRKNKNKEVERIKIQEILNKYNYVPKDIQDTIDKMSTTTKVEVENENDLIPLETLDEEVEELESLRINNA
jgi:hypothetical protein